MNERIKSFCLFLFFFISTCILYCGTAHSKFVFDFIDLVFDFQKRGWSDLGDFSKGFSPYWVAKLIFFLLLKIFRFNVCGWYLITCALHGLNVFLLFQFTLKILKQFNHDHSLTVALTTSVIFLISPYHTEAIVWSGALNYLIVSCFIFLHLNALLAFFIYKKKSSAIIALACYSAAVFSHEWGLFLLPTDVLLYILFHSALDKTARRKALLVISVIVSVTSVYFANQVVRGQLIGHYGAETHLNFRLNEIVPATYKYLLKILLLAGFFDGALQDKIYDFLQRPVVLYVSGLFLLLIIFLSIFSVGGKKKQYAAPAFFFLLFCLFVFPVLNLYFPYWIKIHADRYCYLPSAFLFAGILSLLFLWRGFIKFVPLAVFTFFSFFFLLKNNTSWKEAGELQQKLEKDFRWWSAKHVYILNLPDNIRGAYMYRNLRVSSFAGNFVKYNFRVPDDNITEVLDYNLNSTSDSVFVEKLSDLQLKVTLAQPDSWWWRLNAGATDYENEKVKVDVDANNHSYVVEFKMKSEGDVYLYQANGLWKQVYNF